MMPLLRYAGAVHWQEPTPDGPRVDFDKMAQGFDHQLRALPRYVPSKSKVDASPERIEQLIGLLNSAQRGATSSLATFNCVDQGRQAASTLIFLQVCRAGRINVREVAGLLEIGRQLAWAALERALNAHRQLCSAIGENSTVHAHGREDGVGADGHRQISLASIREELDSLEAGYAPFLALKQA